MKKLLVLALVLSMATMANAGLVITSGDVVTTAATITATGVISDLGVQAGTMITAGAGWPGTGDNFYAVLIGDTSLGTFDFSAGTVVPVDSGLGILTNAGATGMFPANEDGPLFGVTLFQLSSLAAGQQIFDNIKYTAIAAGTQTLSLIETDGATFNTTSTMTITQIPEPMTMCLLGLGGLFLRRRSK